MSFSFKQSLPTLISSLLLKKNKNKKIKKMGSVEKEYPSCQPISLSSLQLGEA
jgi:hypothetical protein